MTQKRTLYHSFADYYDLLHARKDYAGEVKKLLQIIKHHQKSNGRDLLDVACGTGRHLSYFKNHFSCTGIDLHEGMLKIARKKVTGVTFKQAEMARFRLRKRFDVITCLYGGISYALNITELQKTLDNFGRHLKPGGVVIIEPYFTSKQLKPNRPKLSIIETEDIKIARVSLSKRKRNLASRKMIIAIVDKKKGVFSFEDHRDVALFGVDQILSNMESADFETTHIKNGITQEFDLYIGVKR
jgi:ubiquinone/menaquinone biosynthesis C-methylase UbiE